jgi:hypothetical protein
MHKEQAHPARGPCHRIIPLARNSIKLRHWATTVDHVELALINASDA